MKHYYTVAGLTFQGKPFSGLCVAKDITEALDMFRNQQYSVHKIEQGIQAHADMECAIYSMASEDAKVAYAHRTRFGSDERIITYAPMAKTADGQTMFLYDSCMTMQEALYAFETWETGYGMQLVEAWVDVLKGGSKVSTIPFRKVWTQWQSK